MKAQLKSLAKQSPALVIASAALCMSLGTGVGYAASVVTGAQIAPHSIPGNRIVDHSITSRQLAPRVVTVTNLSLKNGWKSSQSTYDTGSPRVITNGTHIAYLAGSLHGGTSGSLAFVLPSGERPSHTLYINIYTFAGSTGFLLIYSNGSTYVEGSSATSYASLAGVSFPIGQ